MTARRPLVAVALTLAFALVLAGCGRTEPTPVDDDEDAAAIDATIDDSFAPEAMVDADEALPPIDSPHPPPDVIRDDCPDPSATLIYLITDRNALLSYYPPTNAFHHIGTVRCLDAPSGTTPFSMAVDRKGTAYVVYNDGELYRVSTKTAACTKTPFVPRGAFRSFGMAFTADGIGPGETLYLASSVAITNELGTLDLSTFSVHTVAPFVPDLEEAELTGTGDGRLFAFHTPIHARTARIAQLDKATATVISENDLPTIEFGGGWAFAFWGGSFYLFTAPGAFTSHVTRFDPSDGSTTLVATFGSIIVGAGVSTCAPEL